MMIQLLFVFILAGLGINDKAIDCIKSVDQTVSFDKEMLRQLTKSIYYAMYMLFCVTIFGLRYQSLGHFDHLSIGLALIISTF